MIYKFIDTNGSEISVNSLSSLQALVDSETIKENTKVKAGLRGKWTTASNIEELIFEVKKTDEPEKIQEPEEDIKSFITKEESSEQVVSKNDEIKTKDNNSIDPEIKSEEKTPGNDEYEYVEEIVEEEVEVEVDDDEKKDEIVNHEEKSEYELEEERRDKTYDDENVIGLNFQESIIICLKKYFNFKDRASRSEYWYFQLLVTPIFIWAQFPSNDNQILIIQLILTFGLIIPAIAAGVRRFHDKDKSGWWILISFIPFVGSIIVLVLLIDKGTEGSNKFGNYPLKLKK
jgi:uncharacterized membrane protein YhaH (DUF805 family)